MLLPAGVFLLLVGEPLLFPSDLLRVVDNILLLGASEPRLLVGELWRLAARTLRAAIVRRVEVVVISAHRG
jgi:hypothetical protein